MRDLLWSEVMAMAQGGIPNNVPTCPNIGVSKRLFVRNHLVFFVPISLNRVSITSFFNFGIVVILRVCKSFSKQENEI